MKHLLLLFFFLYLSSVLKAESVDSVKKKTLHPSVKYFTDAALADTSKMTDANDSLHFSIEKYPPVRLQSVNHHLGNIGTAQHTLIYSPVFYPSADIGFHAFDMYGFQSGSVNYFKTNVRYTDLTYLLGSKSEQLLNIAHAQNISSRINAGIDYRRMFSEGFFKHQQTQSANFDAFLWMHSKNLRYHLFANYIMNKSKVMENGGLSNDSLFENIEVEDNKIYPVTLEQAENRSKEKSFHIRQIFNTGFKKEIPVSVSSLVDTSRTDSAKTAIKDSVLYKFVPAAQFSHALWISEKSTIYEDLLSPSFYYFDSVKTFDSIYYTKFVNEFSCSTLKKKKGKADSSGYTTEKDRKHLVSFSVRHSLIHYRQMDIDSLLNDLTVQGTIENNNTANRLHLGSKAFYNVHGNNANDYELTLFARFLVNAKGDYFIINTAFHQQAPALTENSYHSNLFYWNNDFNKTKRGIAGIVFHSERLKFSVSARDILTAGYIYRDNFGIPRQYSQRFNYFSITVKKDFYWKHFNFENQIIYQYSSFDLPRVPELLSLQSLFYENTLFNRAMQLKTGMMFRNNTMYYADAYMSATRQFYLQNKKKVGNYPLIDFFVSIKVKSAEMTFRMEHLNSGFSPKEESYIIPHYPLPKRILKFGVSWKFFD